MDACGVLAIVGAAKAHITCHFIVISIFEETAHIVSASSTVEQTLPAITAFLDLESDTAELEALPDGTGIVDFV